MYVLERLDRLVRSWTRAYHADDPDIDESWEELERYLRSEFHGSKAPAGDHSIPREVRQAFHDLELPVNSGLEDARRAYRRLLLSYHPDHHDDDPERREMAVLITQRLSMAYRRICAYYGK